MPSESLEISERMWLIHPSLFLPWILRSRAAVELENLALRHQIGVLQRSAAKRLKLTSGDRLSLPKMSSDANAFEINGIPEDDRRHR